MPKLLLDRDAIKTLMRMADVVNVVEEASRMCGEGREKMPAKTNLSLGTAISAQCLLPCRDVRV